MEGDPRPEGGGSVRRTSTLETDDTVGPEQISQKLTERFGAKVLAVDAAGKHPHALLAPDALVAAATFLRDDPELRFDYLRAVSGVDYPKDGKLVCVYDMISTTHRHSFALKVETPRESPHVPSVASVWPTANWHEREAFDLLGIVFDGHPDLTRLLLPEDWVGHPLRKDYVFPKDYNGIPCASLINP